VCATHNPIRRRILVTTLRPDSPSIDRQTTPGAVTSANTTEMTVVGKVNHGCKFRAQQRRIDARRRDDVTKNVIVFVSSLDKPWGVCPFLALVVKTSDNARAPTRWWPFEVANATPRKWMAIGFELHSILQCPVPGNTSIYSASDAGVDDAI